MTRKGVLLTEQVEAGLGADLGALLEHLDSVEDWTDKQDEEARKLLGQILKAAEYQDISRWPTNNRTEMLCVLSAIAFSEDMAMVSEVARYLPKIVELLERESLKHQDDPSLMVHANRIRLLANMEKLNVVYSPERTKVIQGVIDKIKVEAGEI